MKQTAVEWLAEQITTIKWKMSDITDRQSIINQAKAMEKEQIIHAYYYDPNFDRIKDDGEHYYNETFKSK